MGKRVRGPAFPLPFESKSYKYLSRAKMIYTREGVDGIVTGCNMLFLIEDIGPIQMKSHFFKNILYSKIGKQQIADSGIGCFVYTHPCEECIHCVIEVQVLFCVPFQ